MVVNSNSNYKLLCVIILTNPPYIFSSIFSTETKILVQSMPKVIPIKHIGQLPPRIQLSI